MTLFKKIITLGCALVLSGCASTQQLDPRTDLKNGYYTSNIGTEANQGSFKIRAPQTLQPDYMPDLLSITRETGSHYTQINMGTDFPAPNLFSVRVEVDNPNNLIHRINPFINLLLNAGKGRNMKKVSSRKTTLNGHPATYLVFSSGGQEKVSTSDNITNIHITPPKTDGIYLVDYGKYDVIFWITAANDPYETNSRKNAELQRQITNGTWGPEVQFVNSFKLYQ